LGENAAIPNGHTVEKACYGWPDLKALLARLRADTKRHGTPSPTIG
jgi:hypothetical protein